METGSVTHKIIVAGIGPGNAAYLLPKAQNTIANARILVGGRRALEDFAHPAAKTCAIGADIPGVLALFGNRSPQMMLLSWSRETPAITLCWMRYAAHFPSIRLR